MGQFHNFCGDLAAYTWPVSTAEGMVQSAVFDTQKSSDNNGRYSHHDICVCSHLESFESGDPDSK